MQKFFSISRWAGAKRLLSVMLFLCCTLWAMGQTVTLDKIDITHKTSCRNNGVVRVTVKNTSGVIVAYQLFYNNSLKTQNFTGEFTSLNAGKYTLRAAKASDNSKEYFKTEIEVLNKYVPLTKTNPKVTISGLCTQFKAGATITIDPASIQGGTAPFKYALVETDDINFVDDASTPYGYKTEFEVGKFGTYMLRIKDDCGELYTIKNEIKPTLSKVKLRSGVEYSEPCHTNKAQLKTIVLLNPANNGAIDNADYFKAGGLKVVLYAAKPDESGKLNDEELFNSTIKHDNSKVVGAGADFVFKLSSTNKYWSKVTTPCGDVFEGMVANLNTDRRTRLNLRPISAECSAEGQEKMIISNLDYSPFVPKGTVYFKDKKTNTVVQTLRLETKESNYTFKSAPLPLGEYEVWVKHDECEAYDSEVKTVKMSKGDGVSPKFSSITLDFCHGKGKYTSKTGTIGAEVRIDGYVPNQQGAKVSIESGPSNVGVAPQYFQYRYRWFNMLPGDYVIKYEACDKVIRFNLTVPDNDRLLRQKIVSKAISSCSENGKIESTIDYNHYFPMRVELVDDKDQIVTINGVKQVNSTGNFSNVPPGTYKTRIKVLPHCAKISDEIYTAFYYVYNETPLVIVDSSRDPVFVSAQGVACEDIAGNLQNGTIYLTLAAPEDAILQYRKKGDTNWESVAYDRNIVITGLTPSATYQLKLTSCGKTATHEVKISRLLPIIKIGTKHPCKGKRYTLSVPFYEGAVYSWTKEADATVLGTSNTLDFGSFTDADNGVYICKMQWGSCVSREVRYNLNAAKCGEDVGELVAGTVFNDADGLDNNSIDGTPIGMASGKQLYIHVLMEQAGVYEHTGIVQKVESNGTFSINNLVYNGKYRLVLSTEAAPVATSASVEGWKFIGEAKGDQTADIDTTPDGMLNLVAGEGDQTKLRFGIQQLKPTFLRSNRHITTKL